MGVFGDRLRREREMRGITLDEISESTKISRRHLESLEREDFESLPGGVFNKGFVRAYARFLGLNEEQAVADYSAAHNEQPSPPDQFPLEVHEKPNRELKPQRSPISMILAVVALVAVLAAVWAISGRARRSENAPRIAVPAASTPVPTPLSAAPPVPIPAASTPAPTPLSAAPSVPIPALSTPAPTPLSAAQHVSVSAASTPAPTPLSATAVAVPTATPIPVVEEKPIPAPPVVRPSPTPNPKTFVILVRAKEDSWVSLQADGRTKWQGFLKASQQRAIRAGRRVVLTTNNAGGLLVRHNGKLVRGLGSESEVRTLIFTTAGLVQ
jgi:cytoskeleton protein RodZ